MSGITHETRNEHGVHTKTYMESYACHFDISKTGTRQWARSRTYRTAWLRSKIEVRARRMFEKQNKTALSQQIDAQLGPTWVPAHRALHEYVLSAAILADRDVTA